MAIFLSNRPTKIALLQDMSQRVPIVQRCQVRAPIDKKKKKKKKKTNKHNTTHSLLRAPAKIIHVDVEKVVYEDVEPDPRDLTAIMSRLQYWKGSKYSRQIQSTNKYLLIDRDCGGFNNIRMAFEYHVIWAWLTHRTLVLPPLVGFYLLDFGPVTVLAADGKRDGIDDRDTLAGVSRFSDYFDMEAIRGAVPVISSKEFWALPEFRSKLPERFRAAMENNFFPHMQRKEYFGWLFNRTLTPIPSVLFRGMNQFLYWPNKQQVLKDNEPDKNFVDGRQGREVEDPWLSAPAMYYPNCEENMKYRSLTQVAVAVAFADPSMYRAMLSLLRDNVHFSDRIFELAAEGVQELGMWQYYSLHIRRNDLQYKEVFMDASATLDHIKPLLPANAVVYLASDEFDPGFFKPFDARHKVVRLQQLAVFPKIPRRLLGMVEVVICAMGRRFFGTQHSTFTAYIHRLRGYLRAPDTNVYFHTFKYSGDAAKDAKLRPPQIARNYKEEFDVMWSAIQEE